MKSLFILSFYAIIFCTISCGEKKETAAPVSPDVNVVVAGQKTIPVFTEYVGETYGISDIQIQARTTGWILGIHFKEGDFVKKGQLLFTTDDQEIRNRIVEANAQLSKANSMKSKTQSDLDRVEPLVKMNALSQRDLDAAIAANNSAKAEVDASSAALANARVEQGYTRITAPISGLIGINKYQVGDYVNPTAIGGALNTISAVGEMRVRFPISESEYLRFVKRIRSDTASVKGLSKVPVTLILGDGTSFNETGKIDLANRQIDPQTGSLIVQAIFTNKQNILRPGQYVKVRFQTDIYQDAILVPQQAVSQLQSIYQVYVLNDSSKVNPRIVKVGARVGSNWIIQDGLKAGEKVAIIGSAAVNPRVPVKPITMNWNYDSTSVQ
jgi:membrane fusion protein (multidrug efflux system)